MQQYIIDFVNSATDIEISEYLAACGATVLKTFSAFEKVMLVDCASEPPSSDIIEHIKDDTDHTNHIKLLTTTPIQLPILSEESSKTIVTTSQKDWWKVYSGSQVDLDGESFQLPLSGAGATVYMMDSGVMAEHPDFEGADIDFLYSLSGDFVDRKGHGTALASLIVGKTCGITNAKLKVVKIFDQGVPTKLSDFLSALDAIYIDFSGINTYGVINCSWEIERNEYVESKLRTLWLSGVQIIVAAGNTNSEVGNVTPAAMAEAVVVGAYNSSLLPCDFSDYSGAQSISVTSGTVNGGKLSGWAPGEGIYTATLDGGYGFSAGTSVAAAIHSAIIAYNMTLPAFNFDEDITLAWHDATRNNMTFFIKKDLLSLEDAKYQHSPNLVSYLITDHIDPYDSNVLYYGWFMSVATGRITSAVLFNPKTYSSFTLHEPLPAGMSINNYGIFSAYIADPVTGTDNPNRIDYSIPATLTDFAGNSIDIILEIAVGNFDLEILPNEPNAIIPYTLNNTICSPNTFCEGQPSPDFFCSVNTFCPSGGGCICGPKGNCVCEII